MTNEGGAAVAVIGGGSDGVAALIDVLVSVAYKTPDGAPPVKILVWDSGSGRRHRADPYPLHGSAEQVHPFSAEVPPTGFPTFAAYVKDQSPENPSLRDALSAPTWGHINDYLDYSLELAAISFAAQIDLDIQKTQITEIRETTAGGAATIVLSDGSAIEVRELVRDQRPAHMASSAS